jgi:hypothetical protein
VANPFFGDFGDVWKHLVLAELLSIERPKAYWETHAGSASYPLTPSDARNYGAYHFLENADKSEVLRSSRYLAQLKGLPQSAGFPAQYPGSSLLAMLELADHAESYVFCDRDPVSSADLMAAARERGLGARVRCLTADGVAAIASEATDLAALDQVVAHIDPFQPFDASGPAGRSPFDLAVWLAQAGCRVILWYAYDQPGPEARGAGWAWRSFAARLPDAARTAWCGDIGLTSLPIGHAAAGMECGGGCGVVCANFGTAAYTRASELGIALAETYASSVLLSGDAGALTFRTFGATLTGPE